MPDADLDELAARGAKIEEARRAATLHRADRETAAATRFAEASTTPLGVFRTYFGGYLVIMIGLALAGAALLVPAFSHPLRSNLDWDLRIAGTFAAPVVALFVARTIAGVAGARSHARTLAWADALPFPLDGLPALLAASPRRGARIAITMAPGADLESIRLAAAGLDAVLSTGIVDGAVVIVHPNISGRSDDAGPTSPSTNYRALRWIQRVTAELLIPLHARAAIARVAVELADRAR